jgi:transcriptional regulator with XRE-family HTH domain
MRECGFTQRQLATVIGINLSTLNAKLKGKNYFSVYEMDAICEVLNISNEEIGAYFFCKKSSENQTFDQQKRFVG